MKAQYTPLTIGTRTLPGNLFLAPLAGYTDRAFREVCRTFGASFVYSEMISAEAVARGNEKSLALAERGENEDQLGLQIFLSSPEQAERALPRLLHYSPTLIDINCGCPVPKIVKTGAGAALMNVPEQIHRIVSTLSARTEIPITVKLRSGWSETSITFLEAGQASQEGGAAAVGFHPRTKAQGYAGTARHEFTAELVSHLSIPVIASGDLFFPKDAVTILKETGCAGVMFARGALGNPFIFSATRTLLAGPNENTNTIPSNSSSEAPSPEPPSIGEVIETGYRQLLQSVRYKGEERGCSEMKKHLSAYSKGLPRGSALRNELMRCRSLRGFQDVLQRYLEAQSLPPGGPHGWLDHLYLEC